MARNDQHTATCRYSVMRITFCNPAPVRVAQRFEAPELDRILQYPLVVPIGLMSLGAAAATVPALLAADRAYTAHA